MNPAERVRLTTTGVLWSIPVSLAMVLEMLKASLKTAPIQPARRASASVLTAFLAIVAAAQPGQAAALSPAQQVQQVVDWFTGFFTNSAQVASDPTVPFLTMENCPASVFGAGSFESQYVHLEQYVGGESLLRTSAYEFSPTNTGVNLSVFPYLDRAAALGSCDLTTPLIDLSNLAPVSCDLSLVYEPKKFSGSNAPVGCPTSFPEPGSIVISTLTVTADTVDAFDQFITPDGLSFGTPIAYQRVATTPEPMTVVALLGVGLVALATSRK